LPRFPTATNGSPATIAKRSAGANNCSRGGVHPGREIF
jgi:hypothetical protein